MRLALLIRAGVTLAFAAGALAVAVSAAQAAPLSATVYAAPTGTALGADTSCATAAYSTVQAAVTAVPAGGTVIVCPGGYTESVTVTQQLTLEGMKGAVINANGGPYAVGIAHSNVTVEGLFVENAHLNNTTHAPGDGIITAGFVGGVPTASNDDVIVDNIAKNNQGAGIDLNSTTGSIAVDNLASGNGAGVNLSNDLGPASSHNFVSGNDATNNPGGCGIVLADHTGSGVFDNTIVGNFANDNGLGTPSRPNASSGSGVILASAGSKGGVYGNVIESNEMTGNGHGGVALHGHAKGAKFSGNQIIDNTIGTNNKRTDYKDKKTTAIYLGDASKLTIKVAGNVFMHDAIGLFSAGPVTVTGFGTNSFQAVNTKKQHIAKYAG